MRYGTLSTNRFGTSYSRNPKVIEMKYYDISPAGHDNIPSEAAMIDDPFIRTQLVEGIQAGSAANQRIGRKILIKRIMGNMELKMNSHDSDLVKISLVLDKQTNGSDATERPDAVFTGNQLIRFVRVENNKRFQVLWQKVKPLNWTSTAFEDDDGIVYHNGITRSYCSFSIKTNIEIIYTGVGPGIATVNSNNLFVLFQSREGVSTVHRGFRVYYQDA